MMTAVIRMKSALLALTMFGAIAGLVASPLVPTQPASAADGSTIVGTETDADGRNIILRQGTYDGAVGFGWTKIQERHNIHSKNSIGYVLKAPNGGTAQGEDRLYVAYANEITCDSACEVTDSREVRVVNKAAGRESYYGVVLSGGEVGITTAYCVNPDGALACPSWVDRAIGVNKPMASGTTAATPQKSTVWSYSPMMTEK
ncbi:hypothetical protein [Cryobacterium sp. N19]|uniref:hypothetical protein n=1 Tax=Cryobacterium sp. N19 TaxID=2048288 RepID=UPI000CE55969|nr:hypothetical protein [Cryobacterium sp. N19]